ncbi:spermine synthase [candidate division WOR-3 bacterium]|nr:spermine synthase [candidate division WOR-3 bacterium]
MFTLAIIIMGISGIFAETLLLRELLLVFYGNELSIGVVLANWLLLEAIGSIFIGRRIEYTKHRIKWFINWQTIFAIFLLLSILLTRILKGYLFPIPGESLGLLSIAGFSLLILIPVSISHGALFTFSCRIYADLRNSSNKNINNNAQHIGSVYIYETLGTILGGITITYLLIPYFSSLQMALGVSLINLIICIFLQRRSILPAFFLFIFGIMLFSPNILQRINKFSIEKQWSGQNVIHSENSIYGNIVVGKRQNQYTFFSDGLPIITTPVPDIASMEEFIHIPLLILSNPENILIIGGGAGGYLNEILKHHSVKLIDYCELDPLIIKLLRMFPTPLTENELGSERVNINFIDGRLFVKKTNMKYDAVFIGIKSPSDLQINRLFTKEFFGVVKSKLKKNGLLVLTLPGSISYISPQLRRLNLSILKSIESVYSFTRVIPGETNIILASSFDYYNIEESIQSGLREGDLDLNFLTSSSITYKLDRSWLDWFNESIQKVVAKENTDRLPSAVFYNLAYWNEIFSPYTSHFFITFERLNLTKVIFSIIILFIIFLVIINIGRRKRHTKNTAIMTIPFAIVTSGFAGMIFELIIIFTFQTLYGYVYQMIGLLTSLFIAGTGIGGFSINRFLKKCTVKTFIFLDLCIILIALIFSLLLYLPFTLSPVLFFLFSFVCGVVVGAQFPLANKIYLKKAGNISNSSGLLYGSDLIGGWIAGMIGGTAMIPIIGLTTTCIVVTFVKLLSLSLLLIFYRTFIKK